MSHEFDEFSKSLADVSVPRRESLRRLGLLITASVLGPLALGPTAATAGSFRLFRKRELDPCAAFCKCKGSKKQNQCLAACRSCSGETNRLAGSCGSYTCVSLSSDPHCGAINNNCGARGMTCCGGTCADVAGDANNCGACGIVCPSGTTCINGTCTAGSSGCATGLTKCGTACVNLSTDAANCGACYVACASGSTCVNGTCSGEDECGPGLTRCFYGCTDLNFDPRNCGACGHQCGSGDGCSFGACSGTCSGC